MFPLKSSLTPRLVRMLAGFVCLTLVVTACASDTDETATAATDESNSAADDTADASDADSSTDVDNSTDEASADSVGTADGGTLDITEATLTSTAASCTAYVGTYISEITDQSNGSVLMGETVITDDGDICTLQANSIPNHDVSIDGGFMTQTAEVDSTYEIPANPAMNDAGSPLDFQTNAVMINGVIWEAFPAACFGVGDMPLGEEAIGCGGGQIDNPWRYNVGSTLNRFGVDAFYAHTQPTGLYHYHGTPTALYDIDCDGADASPVIGFARDGHPIYGPCFTDGSGEVRSAVSSFVLQSGVREEVDGYTTPYTVGNSLSDEYNGQFIGDYLYTEGAGDLDECNGMVVGDSYGYFVTGEYPYVMACYRGDSSDTFG